jgi:hypothetical protein
VAPPALAFPADTVWTSVGKAQDWIRWALLGFGGAALVAWIMSSLLAGWDPPNYCALTTWAQLSGADGARACFAEWQLSWWLHWKDVEGSCLKFPIGITGAAGYYAPVGALLWDVVFIGLYAYFFAKPMAWAFARRAGLRRVSMTPPGALNVLGQSLKFAVIGDIVENIATLAVICLAGAAWSWGSVGAVAAGVVMSIAAAVKFLGLLGVLLLILWGVVSKAPPETGAAA